jgi:Tol biopolymer transport system component
MSKVLVSSMLVLVVLCVLLIGVARGVGVALHGDVLAFVYQQHIYMFDMQTGVYFSLLREPANYASPVWSADGRLAFTSDRDGNDEIYLWDGVQTTRLTYTAGDESMPAWMP